MFRLPRPLVVGLGIVAPALMIITRHPWTAAATFTVVFATLLLRPRDRAEFPAPAERPRDLVPSGAAPARDDEQPPRPRNGLIHYPPRRL